VAEIDPAVTTDYTDTVSDAQIVINGAAPLEGPAITPITLLVDVLARDQLNYDQAFQVGTLSLTARKGGRILETGALNVTATTTVQELMDYISDTTGIQRVNFDPTNPIPGSVNNIVGESGALVPGVSLTLDGTIRVISNNGDDNGITIGSAGFAAVATDGSVLPTLISFNNVQQAVGRSAVTDFVVYDTLGIPLDVRVTAVLESRTGVESTYRWFADSSDNDPVSGGSINVGTGLIRFD
jgi:flagellar hook protein FlgE